VFASLTVFSALENAQELTAHTRKAKLFRQSKSFVTFGIFVSNKAFRSTFLALQVCAKRYAREPLFAVLIIYLAFCFNSLLSLVLETTRKTVQLTPTRLI
jgi:hypothetical protein